MTKHSKKVRLYLVNAPSAESIAPDTFKIYSQIVAAYLPNFFARVEIIIITPK